MLRSNTTALLLAFSASLAVACSDDSAGQTRLPGGSLDVSTGGTGFGGATAGTGSVAGTGATGAVDGSGATGAVAGTGADAGVGAETGAGATEGAGATTGSGVGCAGAEICDDFEGGSLDESKWGFYPDWMGAPALSPGEGRNGGTAIGLTPTNDSNAIFPKGALPSPAFYARAYIKFPKSTAEMGGHISYLDAATAPNNGVELRLGASKDNVDPKEQQLDVNYIGDGSEWSKFSNGSVLGGDTPTHPIENMEGGVWHCVEVYVAQSEFRAWVNDAEVEGLHVTDWNTHRPDWGQTWTHIKFGPHNYSGSFGDKVYYDDVAVASQRIGCE